MAVPQKKRGFRKIVVDGRDFNWRLNTVIEVRPIACKDNKLEVDFGWFDFWLYMNGPERPLDYDPWVVTPAFVRTAIEFAMANNWDIEGKPATTKISYRNKQFNMA